MDLLLEPGDQQQVVVRPSRNLPPVASCNSHAAAAAVTNGLHGNATATPVDNSNPGAGCDATAVLRYAVRPVSVNSSPGNPAACTRRARSPMLSKDCGIVITPPTCTPGQGNTDRSHGCLNLNGENAEWFFDLSVRQRRRGP